VASYFYEGGAATVSYSLAFNILYWGNSCFVGKPNVMSRISLLLTATEVVNLLEVLYISVFVCV
jgi:hypothetical protein